MGTTWVLHTETKGTGAQMVPLERATKRSEAVAPVLVPRRASRSPEPEAPKPTAPRRFKVVDVMTRQTIADDAGIRGTLETLGAVRSLVDVNVYVWQEEQERWRLLSLAEQRLLLEAARPHSGS